MVLARICGQTLQNGWTLRFQVTHRQNLSSKFIKLGPVIQVSLAQEILCDFLGDAWSMLCTPLPVRLEKRLRAGRVPGPGAADYVG